MTGLLLKFAFVTAAILCGISGWIALRHSYRKNGVGPALAVFLVMVVGFTLPLALSDRDFLTGELFLSPLGVRASQISTVVLLMICLITVARRLPRLLRIKKNLGALIWVGLVSYFVLDTVVGSVFGTVSWFPIATLYSMAVFAALYVHLPATTSQFANSAKLSLAAILYLSAVAAIVVPYSVIERPYEGLMSSLDFRYHGLTGHANILGPVALAYLILEYAYPSRHLFRMSNSAIALTTLILAQSKSAWLGSLALLLVMLYYGVIAAPRTKRLNPAILLIAKALFLSLVPILVALFGLQIFDFVEMSGKGGELSTFTGRTLIWHITYERFLDNPLFGHGPSLWNEDFRFRYGLPYAGQAHNQFLQTLGTGGIVGLCGLLFYVVALAKVATRNAVRTKGATLAFMFMFIAHGFSEAPMRLSALLSGGTLLHLILFSWFVQLSKNLPAPVSGERCTRLPTLTGRWQGVGSF